MKKSQQECIDSKYAAVLANSSIFTTSSGHIHTENSYLYTTGLITTSAGQCMLANSWVIPCQINTQKNPYPHHFK